LHQT
jgi:hypothetical protein